MSPVRHGWLSPSSMRGSGYGGPSPCRRRLCLICRASLHSAARFSRMLRRCYSCDEVAAEVEYAPCFAAARASKTPSKKFLAGAIGKRDDNPDVLKLGFKSPRLLFRWHRPALMLRSCALQCPPEALPSPTTLPARFHKPGGNNGNSGVAVFAMLNRDEPSTF